MFGVLTMHLARLVHYGHSFEGAEDLYNILARFPLQHSFFHLFKPKREELNIPKPTDAKELSNLYLVTYDKDKGIVIGKYHSKFGTDVCFEIHKTEGLKRKTTLVVQKGRVYGKSYSYDILKNNVCMYSISILIYACSSPV